MNLRTYEAATMAQALVEVKRDLGRDAVILHTRRFRKGGLLGLGSRARWEITAAANVNVPSRIVEGQYVSAAAQTDRTKRTSEVKTQVAEIRQMVETLLAGASKRPAAGLHPALQRLHTHLLEQDVPESIATDLVGRIDAGPDSESADLQSIERRLRELIAARITIPSPHQPNPRASKLIALIGPTGVGKTTTIAKLAANFKLRQNKRVGLITMDTYRIAAVDQLKTYAEIIEVPLHVVVSPGELHQAIYAMKDRDVVLVDTAGRSPNDTSKLDELGGLIAAAGADEVHLVIPANANRAAARGILRRFMPLGANRIIVTKLDEAETFGIILTVAGGATAPISYVTTGQGVPDDIAPADPQQLAGLVIGGSLDAN